MDNERDSQSLKRVDSERDRDSLPTSLCRSDLPVAIPHSERSGMSIETGDIRLCTPAECHVNHTVRYPIPIELAVPRL